MSGLIDGPAIIAGAGADFLDLRLTAAYFPDFDNIAIHMQSEPMIPLAIVTRKAFVEAARAGHDPIQVLVDVARAVVPRGEA